LKISRLKPGILLIFVIFVLIEGISLVTYRTAVLGQIEENNTISAMKTKIELEEVILSEEEQRTLDLINEYRTENGLNELKPFSELQEVAKLKAEDLVNNKYFAHVSPTLGTPFEMLKNNEIDYKIAGENLAGSPTPEKAVEAWINSTSHRENILEEKMHIVDYLKDKKILYVNSDDEYLQNIKESKEYNLQKYCLNEAWNIKETSSGISFTTKIYDEEINFSLNLYGIYFIRNIILTIKIAEIYKIKSENIIKAINDFKPIDGRFKVLKNNDITIIDDTFNSCYESVIEGLNITNKMSSKRKIAILGTIGSGANGKDDTSLTHEKVGDYFKNLNFDYLFLIGDYTKHTYKSALKYFPVKNIKRFKSKDALLMELKYLIKKGDLLYLKDAGFQELEEIVEELKTTFNLI